MQILEGAVKAGGLSRSTDSEGNTTLIVPYLITGVSGSYATRAKRVAERLPKIGSRLSGEPGIECTNVDIDARSDTLDEFTATVTYGVPDAAEGEDENGTGSVSFSADTVTEKTTEDINGAILRTEYYNLATFGITRLTHEADVDRPMWTVQLKKTLPELPKTFAETFIATVNSTRWSGYPKRTWLCRNIRADQRPDGKFDVTWLMSYNPATWQLIVNTKINGLIPLDARFGNGRARFDVYRLKDFNQMRVSFSGR